MSALKIKLAVNGASGRMGRRVIALAADDPDFQICAAVEYESHPKLGDDAGEIAGVGNLGIPLSGELGPHADVVIDFSTPEGLQRIIKTCESREIPIVVATTGASPELKDIVLSASQVIPVLMAPSMSLAVNMTMKLARDAAQMMSRIEHGVDVEIVERHHRYKEDAPSGTALHFGKIIAEKMGQTSQVHGRSGRPGPRPANEIGYHALRVGDNVGEHQIIFGMLGETIELSVKSSSRDSYAIGALAAAKFLISKKAGIYGMTDVLGL